MWFPFPPSPMIPGAQPAMPIAPGPAPAAPASTGPAPEEWGEREQRIYDAGFKKGAQSGERKLKKESGLQWDAARGSWTLGNEQPAWRDSSGSAEWQQKPADAWDRPASSWDRSEGWGQQRGSWSWREAEEEEQTPPKAKARTEAKPKGLPKAKVLPKGKAPPKAKAALPGPPPPNPPPPMPDQQNQGNPAAQGDQQQPGAVPGRMRTLRAAILLHRCRPGLVFPAGKSKVADIRGGNDHHKREGF
jgi:hypothetical protein